MKKYVQILEKLNPLLSKYNDVESLRQLDDSKERLSDILDALGLDAKGRDKTRKHSIINDHVQFFYNHVQAFPNFLEKLSNILLANVKQTH